MTNSTENLMNNLPEPMRKVIVAVQKVALWDSQHNYSGNDKDLYFALLDLHKWIRLNEYETRQEGIKKFFAGLRKYKKYRFMVKDELNDYNELMCDLEKWRKDCKLKINTYETPKAAEKP